MKIKINTLILPIMGALIILTVSCQTNQTPGIPGKDIVTDGTVQSGNVLSRNEETEETAKADDADTGSSNGQDSTAVMTDIGEDANTEDVVTPMQFLCYRLGNAYEYSLSYETGDNAEKRTFVHYYKDGMTALYFNAMNINGVSVNVREIEKDGRVFYVMDEEKKAVSYKSPASDILLNELQRICSNGEYELKQENGRTVFEYRVPYQQDESVTSAYRFFMEQGVLKELDIFYDILGSGSAGRYRFSEFSTEPVNDEVFEIPRDFEITEYDVSLFGDEIPPWFE